jgi:hypothetical protein
VSRQDNARNNQPARITHAYYRVAQVFDGVAWRALWPHIFREDCSPLRLHVYYLHVGIDIYVSRTRGCTSTERFVVRMLSKVSGLTTLQSLPPLSRCCAPSPAHYWTPRFAMETTPQQTCCLTSKTASTSRDRALISLIRLGAASSLIWETLCISSA